MATPVSGLDLACFVTPEATFDTTLAAAAGDAVKFNELKIVPEQEWIKSEEHAQSASLQTEIEGLRGGSWEMTTYVSPNGSAGTAPDIHDLIEASGFDAISSNDMDLNASNPGSLQIIKSTGVLYEVINGAWVEQVNIEAVGNQPPTIQFQGRFASYGGMFGDPTTDTNTYSANDTSIVVASGDEYKIRVGAVVKFGSEDGLSNAGYLVTGLSSNGNTLTIVNSANGGGGLGGSLSASQTVTPVLPSSTTAGSPVSGIAHSLTIGGTSVGFIEFKLSYKTGTTGLDQEATTDRANRIVRGMREIEGDIKFYFLDENTSFLGEAWEGTTRALVCRLGPSTAGGHMTITIPAARLSVAEVETPGNESAVYTAHFVARQSATANDELKLTFD